MGDITFSRLAATRALLAGTVLLGANIAEARHKPQHHHHPRHHVAKQATPHETAMAVPRLAPPGTVGVALPQPLDAVQAARLRRIFAAQNKGDLATANRESDAIDTTKPLDKAMLGFVLADRYLGPYYRPGAAELSGWLIYYADQPDARAIYDLMLKRLPKGVEPPPPPPEPKWEVKPPVSLRHGPDPAIHTSGDAAIERSVRDRLDAGQPDSALQLIAQKRGLSANETAKLQAEVAQGLFATNRDEAALALAQSALKESDGAVGLAPYVAGLAAWRSGYNDDAGRYFEAAAIAKSSTPALRAAGSFWAARALQRADDAAAAKFWMMRAAEEPGTFYGLLARRALGRPHVKKTAAAQRSRQLLGDADIEAVTATPEGLAAFALLQVGENDRAAAELRRLGARMRDNPGIVRAIRLIARQAGLSGLGAVADGASDVPDLEPLHGFRVDPALIYGLTRVESNFDSDAVSAVGARGLMQLMPGTAKYMAGARPIDASSLNDPELNLELGQRYVMYLARHDSVDHDLIRLLASYNAGPSRCASWDIHDQGDPLLYIEAIPVEETRVFVQRALAFTWLYAARLGLPAPSLDELAVGDFPRFRRAAMLSGAGTQGR